MKNAFYFIYKAFHSRDIQIFVFQSSPLFLPVSHFYRARSKTNLKDYDVINSLNENIITNFVHFEY